MDEIPIFLGNIQISVKFEITTSQLAQAVKIRIFYILCTLSLSNYVINNCKAITHNSDNNYVPLSINLGNGK